jgi:hypothetical protein
MSQGLLPVHIEKGDDAITAFSGSVIITEALLAFGLLRELDKFPLPGSNRGLPARDFLHAILLTLAGGGTTFEDVQRLLSDPVLVKLCGLRPFTASTLLKWLQRHAKHSLPRLEQVHKRFIQKLLLRSQLTTLTLDLDATAVEAEKQSALNTYLGFPGYMPLLGFIPELDLAAYARFQTGNTPPAAHNLAALQEVCSLLPKGIRLGHFRSDSAAYQADIFNFCQEQGIVFSVTTDFDSAVRSAIAAIPDALWQPLCDADGRPTDREYAETVHCMNKTQKAFRLIVQRTKNLQLSLFAEGHQRHYAFATNDTTRCAPELITWHQGRANSENRIKEVKHGFGLDYLPSGDFKVNAFWFALGILAYNVVAGMKHFALPDDFQKKKIHSLRWLLFHSAGKLIHHGRKLILKLCSISPPLFEVFLRCRSRLYQIAAT